MGVAVSTVGPGARWDLAWDGSEKQIHCLLCGGTVKGGSVGRAGVGFNAGGPCPWHPPARLDRHAVHGRKDEDRPSKDEPDFFWSKISRAASEQPTRYRMGDSPPTAEGRGNGGVRSGRQGRDLAGESPAVLVARVEHVAMPHPGIGNEPGDAWCKRPDCPVETQR